MDGLTLTLQVMPPAPRPISSVTDLETSESNGERANNSIQQPTTGVAAQDARAVEAESNNQTNTAPDVKDIIDQLERLADSLHLVDNTRLSISFREDVNKFVYRGIDRDTGEVITQYPSEEILNQMAKYHELTGLSVDIKS